MNVSTVGGGTVSITPPAGPYLEGTEVTLTAIPEGDWDFIGWAGDFTSSDATITTTMDGPKTLKPVFGTNVAVNEIGEGKVIQTPPNPVPYGSTVSFRVAPDDGYYFFRWAADAQGTGHLNTITISKPNTVISALFTDISPYKEGQLIWECKTEEYVNHSSPAIGEDGTIYIGSKDGNLYAINSSSGIIKWTFETGDRIRAAPVISIDGIIYVGSWDKHLYAVNANGVIVWKYKTGDKIFSSAAIDSDGTIYFGSDDNHVYALHKDGKVKWTFKANSDVRSSPAISSDGTIYIGSRDTNVYALDQSGNKKWQYETFGQVNDSPAIGADGTIYVGSSHGKLLAINPDGTRKWEYATKAAIYSSPSIGSDGTIYIGSYDGRFYALNPNGTLKWNIPANTVRSAPAIGDNGIVYIAGNGSIKALDSSGKLVWAYDTMGGSDYSSPAIGKDGVIYISLRQSVYAIASSSNGPASSPWPMFGQNIRRTSTMPLKPKIIKQPISTQAALGEKAMFQVLVSGDGPFDIQWYKNGQTIDGANERTLSIYPVTQADYTVYSVRIKNVAGKVVSELASLNPPAHPTIHAQPKDQAGTIGKPVIFSVSASPSGVDYQWFKDGYQIDGATQSSHTIPSFSESDAGIYSVRMKNQSGKAISQLAKLTISRVKWQFVGDGNVGTSAIGNDGTIYFATHQSLYAINPDGSKKNKSRLNASPGTGLVLGPDDVIYYGGVNGNLYAVNHDGSPKWEFSEPYGTPSTPSIGNDGTIYFGSDDHKFYAVNPDGTKKWHYWRTHGVLSSAVGVDGTIYFGSKDWRFYALNPNGSEKWQSFRTQDHGWTAPAIGNNGAIYVGAELRMHSVKPIGLKMDNGLWYSAVMNWSWQPSGSTARSIERTAPVVSKNRTIYFGSEDDCVIALNSSGILTWQFKTGGPVKSTPAIGDDGTIYFGSDDFHIYAINSKGNEKWKIKTGNLVRSSPAIGSDGTLYIGSNDHNLYALNSDSSRPAGMGWPMLGGNARRTSNVKDPINTNTIVLQITDKNSEYFTFSFLAINDRNYEIEASTDLRNWKKLLTIKGDGKMHKLIDDRKLTYPYRSYFRVKLVE